MSKINNNNSVHSHTDLTSGVIPEPAQKVIIEKLVDSNIVFKYSRLFNTTELVHRVKSNIGTPTIQELGETERINATKRGMNTVKIEAIPLGNIEVHTDMEINWDNPDFVEDYTRKYVEAFNKYTNDKLIPILISEAQGTGKIIELPVGQSITLEDIDKMLSVLQDNYEDENINAFFSRREMNRIKKLADPVSHLRDYDPVTNSIYGVNVDFVQSLVMGSAFAMTEQAIGYIFPKDMTYTVTNSAQISSLKNSDGTPVNLFEQGMQAIRAVCYFGFSVVDSEGISVITTEKEAEGKTAKK